MGGYPLGQEEGQSLRRSGPTGSFYLARTVEGTDFQSDVSWKVAHADRWEAAGAASRVSDARVTPALRAETTASRLIAMQAHRHSNSVLGLFCIKFCQCVLFSVCINCLFIKGFEVLSQ